MSTPPDSPEAPWSDTEFLRESFLDTVVQITEKFQNPNVFESLAIRRLQSAALHWTNLESEDPRLLEGPELTAYFRTRSCARSEFYRALNLLLRRADLREAQAQRAANPSPIQLQSRLKTDSAYVENNAQPPEKSQFTTSDTQIQNHLPIPAPPTPKPQSSSPDPTPAASPNTEPVHQNQPVPNHPRPTPNQPPSISVVKPHHTPVNQPSSLQKPQRKAIPVP